MVLTSRIKPPTTARTPIPTAQILLNRQDMLAASTHHRLLAPLLLAPHLRRVFLEFRMAGNTPVELAAAFVLDRYDIQR